jgi:DNA modification methylase
MTVELKKQPKVEVYCGDVLEVLKTLPSESVNCCVTSPPYFGLRDYGVDGQIGLEETPDQYINKLVGVFREVKRVLRRDGTVWVNIADSYAGSGKGRNGDGVHSAGGKQATNKGTIGGHLRKTQGGPGVKPKDLIGIPWMLAFALRADGWYLRSESIWHKPNPMTESMKDRPTKAHEQVFLLSKSQRYYYDADAIKEPSVYPNDNRKARVSDGHKRTPTDVISGLLAGSTTYPTRNKRSVWTITVKPFKGAHFATFPPELPETCLLAGSPKSGVVLDPFSGSGTTGIVAVKNGRSYVGIELNPEYVEISQRRFERELGLELDARYLETPEQLYVARTVEASCQCAIAVKASNIVNVESERERRYEEFRERMLALAATELAA